MRQEETYFAEDYFWVEETYFAEDYFWVHAQISRTKSFFSQEHLVGAYNILVHTTTQTELALIMDE
jgi:hypothetical protein